MGSTRPAPTVRRGSLRGRLIGLAVTAIGLYVVWPALLETLQAWPGLTSIKARWFLGMVALETASFVCVWWVLGLSLRSRRRVLIATSQLASNAASRVIPGGAATGGVIQYRMLTQGGMEGPTVASGLTAASVVITAVLFAMPLFTLPVILGGAAIHEELRQAAWLGIGAFVILTAGTAALIVTDRPLALIGRTVDRIRNVVRRRRGRLERHDLADRLRRERDAMLRTLGSKWWQALLGAVGKWVLDYLALLTALAAVGAHPRASLVMLAYLSGAILGMIPITPGGLGFVEAGLTSMLVLAGVPAGAASLAVLAYRLVSYWLPLAAGAVAAVVFNRRYGRSA
ncbi:MAG TPA: lysylphosphatidylglycerol synthase transmembrane domain-containing protein [Actinomycetota bacterium]|jgi:uncharacterized protein (TIRG00374 family)